MSEYPPDYTPAEPLPDQDRTWKFPPEALKAADDQAQADQPDQ